MTIKYVRVDDDEDRMYTAYKAEEIEKDAGNMAYFIKYLGLMTANGCVADPVYIVADPKMKKGN